MSGESCTISIPGANPQFDAAYMRGYAEGQNEVELRKIALAHAADIAKLRDYAMVVQLADEYLAFLKGGKS